MSQHPNPVTRTLESCLNVIALGSKRMRLVAKQLNNFDENFKLSQLKIVTCDQASFFFAAGKKKDATKKKGRLIAG